MPERITSAASWIWALLAAFGAFGGVAKYLHDVSEDRRKFRWAKLISHAVISGFCGLLFGLWAAWNDLSTYAQLFAAGAAGGMGWGSLDLMQWAVRARVRRMVQEERSRNADD